LSAEKPNFFNPAPISSYLKQNLLSTWTGKAFYGKLAALFWPRLVELL
jgi:hypothetical protein